MEQMMQLLIDGAEGLKVLQTSWLSTRAREGELEINWHACVRRDCINWFLKFEYVLPLQFP
jgi:hypothetical protein